MLLALRAQPFGASFPGFDAGDRLIGRHAAHKIKHGLSGNAELLSPIHDRHSSAVDGGGYSRIFFALDVMLNSLLRGQPRTYFPINRRSADFKLNGPIRDTKFFSFILNVESISTISRLLNDCGPAAIFWRVTLIIVNTIQRIFWGWFSSHISKKVHKTFVPSRTDMNSSSAIGGISFTIGIMTTFFHSFPSRIFRTLTHTVSSPSRRYPFAVEATTTGSYNRSKIGSCHNRACPTVTSTLPHRIVIGISCSFATRPPQNEETPKPLIGKINKSSHHMFSFVI